ncbi:MAG: phage tail tape measure protein [Peptococcaceae bacterium]|nr:phage tail tape measure protein [Peptococcaceae bacterium]
MASGRISGITVEISGDTTKLGKALEGVEKQSKSLTSELKGIDKLLKLDPKSTELLGQKQKVLAENIKATSEKLKTLKDTQAQVQEQFDKGEITAEQYRDFQREIVATENKLKALNKEMDSFGSVAAQKIKAAGEDLQKFGEKATDAGKKLMPLSAGIVALGGLTVKSSVDFEQAFMNVRKTLKGTDEDMAMLERGIRDMAKEIPVAASDIAAVATKAGQLGIATDHVLDFTRVMITLGSTTNLQAEEAATALARFANITKMSASDYDRLGSSLLMLGDNFATTEAEIVAMATKLAATGELTGLTQPQILALATAMSSVGIEAEAGGSSMSKLLKEMQMATELGGTKLEQFSKVAGMTGAQFKEAFETDAAGALAAFVEGLGDTERTGKSAIAMLDEMGITEIRLSDTILRLSNASGVMSEAVRISNDEWQKNTALQEETEISYATTAAQLQILKNNAMDVVIQLGNEMLPTFQKIITKVRDVVGRFSEMDSGTKKIIIAVGGTVAAIGPLLIAIGKVSTGIGAVMKIVPAMVTAFTALKTSTIATTAAQVASAAATGIVTVAQWLWNAAMYANPIGLIVLAIVALIAILAALVIAFNSSGRAEKELQAAEEAHMAATKKLEDATRSLQQAQDDLTGAELSAEGASLRVERAKLSLADAIKNYGEGSLEAKEAALSLKQAEEDKKKADENLIESTHALEAAQQEQTAAAEEARIKEEELRLAQEKLERAQRPLSQKITEGWTDISKTVGTKVGEISSKLADLAAEADKKWSAIKTSAGEKWEGIKGAVMEKMGKVLDWFANMNFTWPKIKLPSFGISPPGWKIGDLLSGSIPKLAISWNAKGGILKQPTIFGASGNTLFGGGEAGAEAILPLTKSVLGDIGAGILAATEGGNNALLEEVAALRAEVRTLKGAIQGMQVVLDRGGVVGGIVDKMDGAFKSRNDLRDMGVATR